MPAPSLGPSTERITIGELSGIEKFVQEIGPMGEERWRILYRDDVPRLIAEIKTLWKEVGSLRAELTEAHKAAVDLRVFVDDVILNPKEAADGAE